MKGKRFRYIDEYKQVDTPQIGKSYHLSWAKHGCVWKLLRIDGNTCTMQTPKTRKEIKTDISHLRHTRSEQAKLLTNLKPTKTCN